MFAYTVRQADFERDCSGKGCICLSEKPKSNIPSICERYPGIRMLHGCPMDEESYRRHAGTQSPAPEPQEADPFAAPQDFQAIAAQAQQADQGIPSSPAQIPSEPPAAQERHPITGMYWQQLPMPQCITYSYGSGSYYTSGSYRLTSGSYVHWIFSSGSFSVVQPPYGSDRRALGGYGLHLI